MALYNKRKYFNYSNAPESYFEQDRFLTTQYTIALIEKLMTNSLEITGLVQLEKILKLYSNALESYFEQDRFLIT